MEAGQVDLVIVSGRVCVYLLLTLLLPIPFIPTASFTEVTYICFSRGEHNLHLQCPPSSRVKIIEAKHGRNKWGTCVLLQGSDERSGCAQPSPEAQQCCGRQTCNVTLGAVFIPTCGYSSSFVRIIHECVTGKNFTCENNEDTPRVNNPATSSSSTTLTTTIPTSPLPSSSTKVSAEISDQKKSDGSTTIDPVWLAKINNNTEWTGERHIVVKAKPPGAVQGTDDATLQAVWACLAISLIIVGGLITILIYLWRKRKLDSQSEPSTNEAPDNNNDASLELQDVKSSQLKTNPTPAPSPGISVSPGVINPAFPTIPEPRIIRTASRRYSSMREFQSKDFSVSILPDPEDDLTAPSRLNRTLSMTSFVLSDTLTRKRKHRDGDFQLVIKPNSESEPV